MLVMDLVSGGELFDFIVKKGSLSEKEASVMLKQVIEGIQHLHNHKICHNDIKPENILLVSDDYNSTLKITDFGTSLFLKESVVFDKPTGTSAYHAPEIILHQPCNEMVDMWAFGVVLYITLCGCHPFDEYGNATNAQIMIKAINANYGKENDMYKNLSPASKNLIQNLLALDPAKR